MARIYGRYGGPLCHHYDRLTFVYYRKGIMPAGQSNIAEWTGGLTAGPHHGNNPDVICLQQRAYPNNLDFDESDIALHWRYLTETEFLTMELNSKKHSRKLREHQAELATKHGFQGPIKGGEARALSRFLRSIGKEDCVRRLWIMKSIERKKWPGTAWERVWFADTLKGPVYAFKPFLDGYSFEDFMRVFRMMRPGCKDARKAIKEAMTNPTIKEDLEMLSVFDTLAGMGGNNATS